jgi:FMN phosphatase YigB (HAD superfamily)
MTSDEVPARDQAPELLLVVDFDGTVYRGDAPVRRYARLIADGLPPADAESYLQALERYIADGPAAARASTDTVEAAALRESADTWGAAVHLAARCYGVPAETTEFAFARCRHWMTKPECEIEVVQPLMDTLAGLREEARITLVTNSGLIGLMPLLERLGIVSYFDDIVPGAAKPDGLRRFLQRSLGPDLRIRPWRLFSIGDHYRNDIEPAAEIGAASGYIDRYGRADGPATARAPLAEDLLPALRAWAANPAATPPPAESPVPGKGPVPSESPVPGESPVPAKGPVPSESPVPGKSLMRNERPVPADRPVPAERRRA